ncbi:upstream-binding factor 1-like protein 1 [Tenrec ecaudatus]|uniref:upstream-binding factor 1-like protein 1 n=1 Tax=Tenrec ecaudatus TaxID=94439 RepID=UPI003F5A9E67
MPLPTGQDRWSEADIQTLLERIKNDVPPNDNKSFHKTLKTMNWERVAFKDFSGEMCKHKWLEISDNLRKSRTLTELVLEAQQHAQNPLRRKEVMKHADLPKKPLSAYIRFYKENHSQYTQRYPKLSSVEVTKLLAKKYKELPEEVKQKYSQDFQEERKIYKEKLSQFKLSQLKPTTHLKHTSKRNHVPKRPQLQMTAQGKGKERKSSLETDHLSMHMTVCGEPKKPPMNGYHKFYQDLWSSEKLKHVPPRERMVEIGRLWQPIPQSQKDHYTKLAQAMQKQYKIDLALWLKSLSPQSYAAFRKAGYGKGKEMSMLGSPTSTFKRLSPEALESASVKRMKGEPEHKQGVLVPARDSSTTSSAG